MLNARRRRASDRNAAAAIIDSTRRPTLASLETIRERAFEIYESRGRESGHDLDDWLQAERELRTVGDVAHDRS